MGLAVRTDGLLGRSACIVSKKNLGSHPMIEEKVHKIKRCFFIDFLSLHKSIVNAKLCNEI